MVNLIQIFLYKNNLDGDQSDTLLIFFQKDLSNIVRFTVLSIFVYLIFENVYQKKTITVRFRTKSKIQSQEHLDENA